MCSRSSGNCPDTSSLVLALLVLALISRSKVPPHAPAPLIAIGLAIAASAALGLNQAGVAVIGAVPGGLPGLVRRGSKSCGGCGQPRRESP